MSYPDVDELIEQSIELNERLVPARGVLPRSSWCRFHKTCPKAENTIKCSTNKNRCTYYRKYLKE